MDDSQKLVELRKKFSDKYVDPPGPRTEKFDPRDLTRVKEDDLYTLSFLHWKKDVIDDAVEMLADVLQWRKENGINDLSVESIGKEIFENGSIYTHGRDLEGLRVVTTVSRLRDSKKKDKERQKFLFWLERLQRCEPGKRITFILDLKSASSGGMDMSSIRFIIDAFTTYFPDLLERIIILDLPFLMNAICSVITKWLSSEQKGATVYCSSKDLHKYVAPDQVPEGMGGTDPWKFSFPPFPDDLSQDFDFKGSVTASKEPGSKRTTDVGYASGSDRGSPEREDKQKEECSQVEAKMQDLKVES